MLPCHRCIRYLVRGAAYIIRKVPYLIGRTLPRWEQMCFVYIREAHNVSPAIFTLKLNPCLTKKQTRRGEGRERAKRRDKFKGKKCVKEKSEKSRPIISSNRLAVGAGGREINALNLP